MIPKYVILFFIYSIAGWIAEMIFGIIVNKRIVNRGFLIGPYCPIYGLGVVTITLALSRFTEYKVIVVVMSMVICGLLEYLTSYFLEKIFHARWWDYSKQKFNINGRVCLEMLVPFGIAGYVITYLINPFFMNLLNAIPQTINITIAIILTLIFTIDAIISLRIIFNLKKIENYKKVSKNIKDNTEEISKRVIKIILDKRRLHMRIIRAFPNIGKKLKIKEWLLEQQEKLKELSQKISKQ